MTNYQYVQAPLGYQGGKSFHYAQKVGKWVLSLLPPAIPNSNYIEPFCGMASVFLNRPKVANEVINDLNGSVANFWKVLRDNKKGFIKLLQDTERGPTVFSEACDFLDNLDKRKRVKWAWAFFVVCSQSFHHTGESRGYGRGKSNGDWIGLDITGWGNFKRHMIEATDLYKRIADVGIENQDAIKIIERYKNNKKTVIYCDPPYDGTSNYYGADVDVSKFIDTVRDADAKVAISGYSTCPYDELGWQRNELERLETYGINAVNVRVECLWTNYDPAEYSKN